MFDKGLEGTASVGVPEQSYLPKLLSPQVDLMFDVSETSGSFVDSDVERGRLHAVSVAVPSGGDYIGAPILFALLAVRTCHISN